MDYIFRFLCFFGTPLFAQTEQSLPEYFLVNEIRFVGSQRTKNSVIERELLFVQGDSVVSARLLELISKSKTNILKTSLFNFVDITYTRHDEKKVDVKITVQERWYIIPRFKIKTVEENVNAWLANADLYHLSFSCSVSDENFRGCHENLSLISSVGFNKSLGLRYFKPEIFNKYKIGLGAEFLWIGNDESINGCLILTKKSTWNQVLFLCILTSYDPPALHFSVQSIALQRLEPFGGNHLVQPLGAH